MTFFLGTILGIALHYCTPSKMEICLCSRLMAAPVDPRSVIDYSDVDFNNDADYF